jgi:iron complex outermembrane receptor protein
MVWGGGTRHRSSSFRNSATLAFQPVHRSEQLYNAFVQHEVRLAPDRLSIILGSKFEHNAFTGFEVQPSARLLWIPSLHTSVWAAVSRAVRTPSYFELGAELALAVFPGDENVPNLLKVFGSPQVSAEALRAYEAGYRAQWGTHFSIDAAGFYNVYHHLRTWEPALPFVSGNPQPHMVLPLLIDSRMRGESAGAEATMTIDLTRRWRVSSAYSWLSLHLHLEPDSHDFTYEAAEGESPQHQVQFRSDLDLGRSLDLNTSVYRISRLPALSVPAYTRIDARLGWRPRPAVEVSVGGRNLQGGLHLEYISEGPYSASRVGRSFYARVLRRF